VQAATGSCFSNHWKNGMKKSQTLEKRIGYRFKNKQRLRAALTHPSYRYENPEAPSDNQRLEFLGDSVLGLLAADALMRNNTEASEGELTKMRSALTSGTALAEAMTKGVHPSKLAKELVTLLDISSKEALTIARTEMM